MIDEKDNPSPGIGAGLPDLDEPVWHAQLKLCEKRVHEAIAALIAHTGAKAASIPYINQQGEEVHVVFGTSDYVIEAAFTLAELIASQPPGPTPKSGGKTN